MKIADGQADVRNHAPAPEGMRSVGLLRDRYRCPVVTSLTMMRELLVLRHAKSAWNTDAPTDFDRPLAKRGRRDAPRVGRFLRERGLSPDYVVSSPAERARQTVIAVCEPLGIEATQIHWDERIYHASSGALIDVLNDCPSKARRVLIAGHNPGLELLVRNLCDHDVPMPDDYKLMPTAAVAHLEIRTDWAQMEVGTARLLSLTRARSLRD
jgi:phosphohistidine phosphatase